MSIFASQFGYANPYDPIGLDKGVLEVGATVPRGPKKPPGEDPAPTRVPARPPSETTGESGLGRTVGESAGLAQQSAANSQATRNAFSQMAQEMGAGAGAGAGVSTGIGANMTMPRTSGANVPVRHAPQPVRSAPQGSSNPLSAFGHWLSNTGSSINRGLQTFNRWTDPFAGTDPGVMNLINGKQFEPSSVGIDNTRGSIGSSENATQAAASSGGRGFLDELGNVASSALESILP